MSNLTISTEPVDNNPVLKKLFKKVYVTSGSEKQTTDDVAKVNHIGNNKRNIFIGTSEPGNKDMTNEERSFLQKILAAVKLSEEDVFIASARAIEQVPFN